ncbi:MAG: transporter substrate-binding domain-containing protein [Myxococcota bacterium]|nr:transporter substrate-binding domain-containing protein [Myxococcota bacterium]
MPLSPVCTVEGRVRLCLVLLLSLDVLAGCAASTRGSEPSEQLRIGTSLDYHPFSTRRLPIPDPASSESIDGFDIAVARAFENSRHTKNVEPRWVRFVWPELQSDFEANRFDIAMSGVTVRTERSLSGRFSVPVAVSGAVAIVRHGFAIQATDLNRTGTVIAVNAGGHLERVTRRHFPKAHVIAVSNNLLVMPEFLEGRADAAITDIHEVRAWRGTHPGLAVVGPFTRDYKAYWVQPNREDLSRELDLWLIARERDGTLGRLRQHYFGKGDWERTALPATALAAAVAERRSLMSLVAEAKRQSGASVEDPERETVVLDAGVRSVERAAAALGIAAPAKDRVRAFFQSEIDAAKRIQRETLSKPRPPGGRLADLKREIRPALLRIGDRIAMLLVERERSNQPTTDSTPRDLAKDSPSP